jgi:inner membrane protein
MASAVTHSIVGALIANAGVRQKRLTFSILAALCSALPDFDVIGVLLGVGPSSIWRHRGMTHSLLFAFVVGLIVTVVAFRSVPWLSRQWWLLVAFFFCATTSHGILDAFTDSIRGVTFFAPFSNAEYLFPYRPIPGIGLSGFFTSSGEAVLLREIYALWLPGSMLMLLSNVVRRRKARCSVTPPTR